MAKKLSPALNELKESCENDLFKFAKTINPNYMYGSVHEEIFRWMSSSKRKDNLLLLIPRAHLKSHCLAVYTAWKIIKRPDKSFVYLSAGEDLAKAQMYAIKNMLTSDWVKKLWPDLIKTENDKDKEVWNAFQFNVDHPLRKESKTRDATLIIKTVKSSATGLHADELLYDDVVVPANAYTESGRKIVADALTDFVSILNPNGLILAVGTEYHPKDAYQEMKESMVDIWDEKSQSFIDSVNLWDILTYKVEDNGDMTGNFLWPRTVCPKTGNAYGFDPQSLAKIRAQYASKNNLPKFFAQYYNEPNDITNQRIEVENFQYYNRKHISIVEGKVYFKDKKLNIIAGMDVAWTVNARSDYTAIAVVGIDSDGYIYILDLDQYKTDKYEKYYESIMEMANKWKFKKIIIETNSGGKLVSEEVKKIMRKNGESIAIIGRYTAKSDGSKTERHSAILEPRYASNTVFHYEGGFIPSLEEQIKLERPKNDDLKDAVTTCISELKPPSSSSNTNTIIKQKHNVIINKRFGGRKRG